MAKTPTITRDDWMKALAEAGLHHEDDQQSLTIPEFMEMMGLCSLKAAADRLNTLVAKGKAKKTHKIAPGADGRRMARVSFRLLP